MALPISIKDVRAARERIRLHVPPSPVRRYPTLDAAVGCGIRVWVKHENHLPTGAFKVRNAMSALSALTDEQKERGVVAASRGNHGAALAWAGERLGIPVTICVPWGNNKDKNEAIVAHGARLVEEGNDYDEAVLIAQRMVDDDGLCPVHSTNDPRVIAGAGTLALEIFEEVKDLDAMVVAVGGGSQAVGAIAVAQALSPNTEIYAVQARNASAIHDAWVRGVPVTKKTANTFADGLATRSTYELTFDALREHLAGFVKVSEGELAAAVRTLLRTTHNLAEGAGAAGLAGLMRLREGLAGQRVGIVLSGGNIDQATLVRVLAGDLAS